jgi:hypothetical protein
MGVDPGFFGDDVDGLQVRDGAGVIVNSPFPYFTRWRHSPFLGSNGDGANDIVHNGSVFAFGALHMGLSPADAIDGLVLMDVTPDQNVPGGFLRTPNGQLDPGFDLAIYSLDPFSLAGLPGDLFFTTFNGSSQMIWSAANLQLDPLDNVDALSLRSVPEPGGAVMVIALIAAIFLPLRRCSDMRQMITERIRIKVRIDRPV